tara:strand:- start:13841 stop:14812 length:972 start_codon:yes stop_codon:yes gene_type:complete
LIAASADEFHSLVEAAIEERALGHAAPPPLQEWLENYRQGPGSALIDVFSGLPDVVSAFSSSLQLPGDRHLDPNLTMIRVPSDEVLAAVLKHQESAFEIDDEDVLPHMTSCAGQFLLQVWLPSWVLHREYPTRLFALASEGDVDALVALVELDKCAILAPELAPHWDHAMREAPDGVRRRCLAALARESLEAPTTSETRAGLGRLIRELAPFCSCKISAPEIGRLFHAVRMVKAAQATHRPVPIIEPKSHKPGPRITHRTDRPPPATPHSLRPLSLPCANPIDPPPRIVGPAPPVPLDSTALLPARAGVSRPGTGFEPATSGL